MTYYITKFNSNELNSGTQLYFKTAILEAWLTAISQMVKAKIVDEKMCLWYKQVRDDGSEHTFFTFFDNPYNMRNYAKLPFVKKPEFIFEGVPEGVKYVQM